MPGAGSTTVAMSAASVAAEGAPARSRRILVGLDASDHANRALSEAVRLAATGGGTVTGIHAYAAKLHDQRFRQMEGGLPERYREEGELERQRRVHDSLITRGLGIIGDSYHDAAEKACAGAAVPYRRLSPEGKNYRRIAEAAASGEFDLVVLGAMGLGAVPGSSIGTVCERVTRRAKIDVLVIRDHHRPLGDGPLVVGIDGSPQSYGALRTALEVGRYLGVPVHAVAAYDPYFHYVAFRRIAGGLSEEAGRVFRFKEQEQLHEEIIDDGLAKIYRSHLEIARAVAREEGAEIEIELLDGKPFQAISAYLSKVRAGLLIVGKTGVHADQDLDIGGTSENLLRLAPCHVWIGTTTHTPPFDAVARETIVWSAEAEEKIGRVPETVRNMVRMVILRYAQEQGHTVITSTLVEEATARFCPGHGKARAETHDMPWSEGASAMLAAEAPGPAGGDIRLRAEKRARREGAAEVSVEHVRPFLAAAKDAPRLEWCAAALARLARVPEMGREPVRQRAEARARQAGQPEVSLATLEGAIEESRRIMQEAMRAGGHPPAPGSPGGTNDP
ncbi:MAG: universal stress protein UspA [Hyphomicrobiaceae bacterium]|nr:MAG: universal stress protein UspA [Hyphomicrobiaceae bacterium]